MALFMTQFSYTPEAWAALVKKPQNRTAAIKGLAEKLGLKLTYEEGPGEHEWGYWDRQIQRVLAWLPL